MKNDAELIIIGGGISGLALLREARRKKVPTLLLEKAPSCGGVWRTLPAWQDIQALPEDWTLNHLPIQGVQQPAILENIRAWIPAYQLESSIQCNQAVTQVIPTESGWEIQTSQKTFRARHLAVASGAHNLPFIPDVIRQDARIPEFHSSQLHAPETLRNKRVAIIGGGASAYDLIELALTHQAREIRWIHRGLKWMSPTKRSKQAKANLRKIALDQMRGASADALEKYLNQALTKKYREFGIEAIRPETPLDLDRDPIIPGRALLIKHFNELRRHPGEIREIVGEDIFVGEERIAADILLWGTGYRMDLSYLQLPEVSELRSSEELSRRCGSLMISIDYPNLYFFACPTLDVIGSTPLMTAVLAKSLVAHIRGRCRLPLEVIPGKLHHWDILKFLARHDRSNYWPGVWKIRALARAYYYERFPQQPLRV